MARPLLTLRDDSVAVAGSRAKKPIRAWLDCTYGAALDDAEPCVLRLASSMAVVSDIAVRDVLYLRNEVGDTYEYRVLQLDNGVRGAVTTVTAAPLFHDLNNYLVTTLGGNGEIPYVSATHPASGWWDFVIAPVLARYGVTHWQRGTFDLLDDISLEVTDKTVLGLLRQLVEGTVYKLQWRLTGGVYYVDMVEPTVAWEPRVLVGKNVVALDRQVDGDQQVTRAYPTGQAYPNGTPSGIGGTPWQIGATVGQGVEILDPEFDTADFAIEPDQYAPLVDADGNVLLEGFSMVASRGTEILTLPASGSSTRWTESICAAGRKLYVPARNLGVGEVHPYNFATAAWGSAITVGPDPVGICHAWPYDKVFVGISNTDNCVRVISTATDTVVATISTGGVSAWHCLYVASIDRVLVGTSSGLLVIDPSDNSVVATVTGGTGSAVIYQMVVVGDEIWAVTGGGSQYVKRFTLAATPTYIGEYDVGLESGAGPDVLCYDQTNDRVWISYWVANKLKVLTRATGAVHTTFNTATTPNAGPPRWLQSFNGVVYATHTTGRLSRWNGATPAYVDITTVDASGGEYWSLTPLGPDESTVVAVGSGKRVAWWDMYTHSVRSIRRVLSVAAGDPSSVVFGGGNSVPFAEGDFTTLITNDFLPVTSLPSPLAVGTYGEVQRRLPFPNARLVPNMLGRPGFELAGWSTAGQALRHWAFESTMAVHASNVHWTYHTPDANTGGSFACQVSVARAPGDWSSNEGTLPLKGLPASLVVQAGDFFQHATAGIKFMAVERVAADGSGNVTVRVITLQTAAPTLNVNDNVTMYRPLPATMADRYGKGGITLVGNPLGASPENKLLGDVYLSPSPAEGLNLYLSFDAGWRGVSNGTNDIFDVRVLLRNWSDTTTLEEFRLFDHALTLPDLTGITHAGTGMSSLAFTFQVTDPAALTDWRYKVRIQTYVRTGWGTILDFAHVLYFSRMALYWSDTDLGAFRWSHQGALHKAWDAASDSLFERSEPLVNYRVRVLEESAERPFALGARCDLRDGTVTAHPKVVAWRRRLLPGSRDLPLPELELDNRTAALTRLLVNQESV